MALLNCINVLRGHWRGAIALLLSLAAGCAGVPVPEVPAQRNLSVLQAGASRTEVLAELGAPIWTEEHDRGAVDVFVFKQGYRKGIQAMRAVGLGAANLVSLGSKRAETDAALADGTDMTVRVLYDETHHVDSVSVLEGEDALSRQEPLKSWLSPKSTPVVTTQVSSKSRPWPRTN